MRAKPEKRIERQNGKPRRGGFPEVGGRARVLGLRMLSI